MSEVTSIKPADLRKIENNLGAIHSDLKTIDSGVDTVNSNIKVVYSEIGELAREFHEFVAIQDRANKRQIAHTELVRIRQELEQKYGHYDMVRRTTTGILQADDLGIVRTETISTATEELMISSPGYWLAPCLVALAAWISDRPELAEKAVREGIKRNDEKTSLFFALVCRRADRKSSALKWTQRYLANQNEEDLDRKTVIVLDAYASGLLGADSEGVISAQMGEWLDHLAEKPGFVEQQTSQWSDAINLKRKPIGTTSYTYLKKHSPTWSALEDVLEGAMLHAEILEYFANIFEQEISNDSLKEQLDEILNSLVCDFDDEEIPLRKEETLNQFIIDFDGDVDRAKSNMKVEETAFETHKDFTQLLTDAAMKPESSHASPSTQKFAIALSKTWISDAYNDIIAKNRMKVPNEIEIKIDSFSGKTTEGQNEGQLLAEYNMLIDQEKEFTLSQFVLTSFDSFMLPGGIAIGLIGLIMCLTGSLFLGMIAIICGVAMALNYKTKVKKIESNRASIQEQYEKKRKTGSEIIRALLAEVVDYRIEFAEKDSESEGVSNFLEQISPEQYVRKLSDSNRRVRL